MCTFVFSNCRCTCQQRYPSAPLGRIRSPPQRSNRQSNTTMPSAETRNGGYALMEMKLEMKLGFHLETERHDGREEALARKHLQRPAQICWHQARFIRPQRRPENMSRACPRNATCWSEQMSQEAWYREDCVEVRRDVWEKGEPCLSHLPTKHMPDDNFLQHQLPCQLPVSRKGSEVADNGDRDEKSPSSTLRGPQHFSRSRPIRCSRINGRGSDAGGTSPHSYIQNIRPWLGQQAPDHA
ncbi:hypothetical protein IWX90DRAFT_19685 [Phyllosticta citrichinensis]|uniref:Uncharacterized protein n=1 Tax=Phyllosticta citrichinensis TaxID=1130410 RepID=A0ABR1Y6D0_9PEZI